MVKKILRVERVRRHREVYYDKGKGRKEGRGGIN